MANQGLCIKSELGKNLEKKSRSWIFSGSMTVFQIINIQDFLKSKNLKQELAGISQWILDFKLINQIDTAGIAYVLACIRAAELYSCELNLINFPEEAEKLAKAQGVFDFLRCRGESCIRPI